MRFSSVVLLIAISVFSLHCGVHAVRRQSDDEYSDEQVTGDQHQAPSHASEPMGGGSTDEQPQTAPGNEGEDQPPPKTLAASFVPVIAIMLVSKSVPALDTGGSSIPMLISVLLVPRVITYLEQQYGLAELEQVPGMVFVAVVSVGQFAMVVLGGKALGFFGDPGAAMMGKQAGKVDTLEYIQGEPVDVERTGSIKVVEFWTTWCGPCKKAIPHINKLYNKLVKESGTKKIQFVGVAMGEDAAKAKPFVEEMGDEMQYAVAVDPQKTVAGDYPIAGFPHAYIVDADGNVAWSGHPGTSEFTQTLEKLVAAVAPAAKSEVEKLD